MSGPSKATMGSVLILADEFDHHFYRLLNIEGEETVICTPGDASALPTNYCPDLVVIDAGFDHPEMGLGLIRGIKERYAAVPVIFFAGESLEGLEGKSRIAGARVFLKRPLSLIELEESIRTMLRLKRSSREKRTSLPLRTHDAPRRNESHEAASSGKPIPLLRSIRYIRKNLSSDISVSRLAEEAHLSKYHFCRLFKRHCKMTPMEYVALQRITRATELLQKRVVNISEAALESGYRDMSTFIRHFRKFTGMNPSRYRKSITDLSV